MKKELVIANLEQEYLVLSEKYNKLTDTLGNENLMEDLGKIQGDLIEDQLAALRLYLRAIEMRECDLQDQIQEEVTKKKQEKTQKKKQENKEENNIKEEKENKEEECKKKFDQMISCVDDAINCLKDYINSMDAQL